MALKQEYTGILNTGKSFHFCRGTDMLLVKEQTRSARKSKRFSSI